MAPVSPERWFECGEYLFGCDLHNHGYWWEAHESWEGLWRVTPAGGAQRHFLQGIIQIAAIHLQLFQGHAEGVARLRGSSREHLARAEQLAGHLADTGRSSLFMGLRMAELQNRLDDYCTHVLAVAGDPPWHDVGRFPYLLPRRD